MGATFDTITLKSDIYIYIYIYIYISDCIADITILDIADIPTGNALDLGFPKCF